MAGSSVLVNIVGAFLYLNFIGSLCCLSMLCDDNIACTVCEDILMSLIDLCIPCT